MISVSFIRKNDSRVVSAPFLREYIYYGGCFLPVSLSANEAEGGSHPKGTEEVARVRASGLRDASSHGAEQDMPISGQQVTWFLRSGDPALERYGDKARS